MCWRSWVIRCVGSTGSAVDRNIATADLDAGDEQAGYLDQGGQLRGPVK
jgi:hypothetical protein